MAAYYNENDPYAAQWLRNLIAAGHIAPGDVDERSIVDVAARDLAGYTQCHFFAGIGAWSYALRLARWPDDRAVWTGSCPCQPFSNAGRREGTSDARHLYPTWADLIGECKPAVIFGEQVEAAIRLHWLDVVFADLESKGYACGANVLGAHSVGAPHKRQRIWFVADAGRSKWGRRQGVSDRGVIDGQDAGRQQSTNGPVSIYQTSTVNLGDAQRESDQHQPGSILSPQGQGNGRGSDGLGGTSETGILGDAGGEGWGQVSSDTRGCGQGSGTQGLDERSVHQRTRSPWANADWIPCRDGKARPVEPGTFPLAHGATGRVGRLRAYGNAIVPQVAAEFISAYLGATGER